MARHILGLRVDLSWESREAWTAAMTAATAGGQTSMSDRAVARRQHQTAAIARRRNVKKGLDQRGEAQKRRLVVYLSVKSPG